eukprot:TRINITY_DN2290_c0_g1_i1.p1 TRINITY_DN2290_c0_g1~~TRINITY_DN2290_c0_g1_i1.p1  ORF type:complete len:857 (-),score=487.74 TRINITY_DN2290_c0_g1_i1:53-2593(-)
MLGGKSATVRRAIEDSTSAPKRKHVRDIIVDSWNYGEINVYKQLAKEPLDTNALVCFKAFTVIHKLLQEGSPRILKASFQNVKWFLTLQQIWTSKRDLNPHYGRLCAEYAYFIRAKITFHHKHPLIIGNLSLDDYRQKIRNQPEVPLAHRQQLISHLLDLQTIILRVQATIFLFKGKDLHESKVAALLPLVVESDAIYNILVHHIKALCDRTSNHADIDEYLTRFYQNYPHVRFFYENARLINYVNTLMNVPHLPADPPKFVPTGELHHLVPSSDHQIVVTGLMPEFQVKGQRSASDSSSSSDDSAAAQAQREKEELERQLEGQQQLLEQQRQEQARLEQQQRELQQQQLIQQQQMQQQLAAQQQQASALNATPELLQQYHQQLYMLAFQYQQLQAQVQLLQAQLAQKEQENQMLRIALQEQVMRSNDLENHLQEVQMQHQREKQEELLRKISRASGILQNALKRFADEKDVGNPSARPDDMSQAVQAMRETMANVRTAALNRAHADLLPAIKSLAGTMSQQLANCKGIINNVTDDPAMKSSLVDSVQAQTEQLEKLLKTIHDNPYDAESIVGELDQLSTSVDQLQQLLDSLVQQEKSDEHEGFDIFDAATRELFKAAAEIERCAQSLLQAKQAIADAARNQPRTHKMEVDDAVLEAAVAITSATQLLMTTAAHLQEETSSVRQRDPSAKLYRKDVTWAQGLISAARNVAESVSELVRNANGAVQGTISEEALIVCSKNVAAATTQLVVASRVRSDPNNPKLNNLEKASQAVAKATRMLVEAARAGSQAASDAEIEEQLSAEMSQLSMTQYKIKEMEQQTRILKLEREIETERKRLAKMRESQYSQ